MYSQISKYLSPWVQTPTLSDGLTGWVRKNVDIKNNNIINHFIFRLNRSVYSIIAMFPINIAKYYATLEDAQEVVDKNLIENGHIFLTKEKYEKMISLL